MVNRFRKHVRLKGFDYSQSLYYFITICTDFRKKLLELRVCNRYGHGLDDDVVSVVAASYAANDEDTKELTDLVEAKLNQIPEFYDSDLDFYVIMPDHIHFILGLNFGVVAPSYGASGKKAAQGAATTNLPKVITAFKSWVTREAGLRVFQPNYYEHIIRSEDNLDRIRNYILNNPLVEYQDINWKQLDPSL